MVDDKEINKTKVKLIAKLSIFISLLPHTTINFFWRWMDKIGNDCLYNLIIMDSDTARNMYNNMKYDLYMLGVVEKERNMDSVLDMIAGILEEYKN